MVDESAPAIDSPVAATNEKKNSSKRRRSRKARKAAALPELAIVHSPPNSFPHHNVAVADAATAHSPTYSPAADVDQDGQWPESAATLNVRPAMVVTQTRNLEITPMGQVVRDPVGGVNAVPHSTLQCSQPWRRMKVASGPHRVSWFGDAG